MPLRFNAYPTDLTLTAATVSENQASGTTIGTFDSIDPNEVQDSETHTYSLVSGTGSTDNASFTIAGTTLKTKAVFNYEADASYAIRVRTTDSYGGTYEEALTITIVDINETPTSLNLSVSSVSENQSANTVVGTLSAVDPDAGATVTYALTSGTGSTDNGSFNLNGTQLRTSASFNYEAKNAYNIRVQVTDNGGLTLDNIFTIRINNANDAPVATDDTYDPAQLVASGAITLSVLTNDTDQDIGDSLTVASVGAASSGTATRTSTSVVYTPTGSYNGSVTIPYTTTDDSLTDTATVTVQVVAADDPGDCNGDGPIDAGDFAAIVLEIFDTDASSNWYETYQGEFAGSPLGCDANGTQSVNISDLTCTVLFFFGNSSCTSSLAVAAQAITTAELAIAPNLVSAPNGTVTVPIWLQTHGNSVAAASFALEFEETLLRFDPADANGDGLPDAVTFQTPSGMVAMATYNQAAGRLEVSVYAVTVPMPTLRDGLLATVTFRVTDQTSVSEIPLSLLQGSLGNDQGQSVPVQVYGGAVRIAQQDYQFFLPQIQR